MQLQLLQRRLANIRPGCTGCFARLTLQTLNQQRLKTLFGPALLILTDQLAHIVYTNVVVTAGKLQSASGIYFTNQESVLYSLNGQNGTQGMSGSTDGAEPTGNVSQASDGNFYGLTNPGGAYGEGTVYKLTNVIPVP
jgi:uncharacterized repeat protein (TIGR03803 family)